MLSSFSFSFRGELSSDVNLIFICFYYILDCYENLIRSLIMLHSSSYFFSVSLLPSVKTSVKYLLGLISPVYPFVLLIIMYWGFTLFVVLQSMQEIRIFLYKFSSALILFELITFYIDHLIEKVIPTLFIIKFFYIIHFILIR